MTLSDLDIDLILRLFVGSMLGGIIGLEREYRSKFAGFRTHFLVALGSSLFMVMSIHGFDDLAVRYDASRIAAQIVSGIGFIGAGAIMFQKHAVRGLTTAAGLWVTAAIGVCAGSGKFLLAIAATVMVLLCLETLNFVLSKLGKKIISLSVSAHSKAEITTILQNLKNAGFKVDTYNMELKKRSDGDVYELTMEVKVNRKEYDQKVSELFAYFDDVSIDTI